MQYERCSSGNHTWTPGDSSCSVTRSGEYVLLFPQSNNKTGTWTHRRIKGRGTTLLSGGETFIRQEGNISSGGSVEKTFKTERESLKKVLNIQPEAVDRLLSNVRQASLQRGWSHNDHLKTWCHAEQNPQTARHRTSSPTAHRKCKYS